MLDVKFITENAELVKNAMATRSGVYDVDKVLALNARRKEIIAQVEKMKAERNRVSDEIAALKKNKQNADDKIAAMKKDNEGIKKLDEELTAVEAELKMAVMSIPNVPHRSVPVGKDDSQNKEVRKWGEPTKFDFAPKAHWDLGADLDILDPATAAKISGARFMIYRGAGARLERAITNFMLDTHTQNGYTEVFPPFMVNRDSMYGTGQLPKFEEDAFAVKNNGYFLVPTAEVPVTNMHRGEVIDKAKLPIRYCAYTACFRAEAGSAGRDTRGLIRLHQFNKVELVKFCAPENSYEELGRGRTDLAEVGSAVSRGVLVQRRSRLFVRQNVRHRSVDAQLRPLCRDLVLLRFRGLPSEKNEYKVQRKRQNGAVAHAQRQRSGGGAHHGGYFGKFPKRRRYGHRAPSVASVYGHGQNNGRIIKARRVTIPIGKGRAIHGNHYKSYS